MKVVIAEHNVIALGKYLSHTLAIRLVYRYLQKWASRGGRIQSRNGYKNGCVLIMAWVIVFARGKQAQLMSIDKKELLFIGLSGIATGASWLCYYYAIQNGEVSVVVPVDKLSIIVTVIFSYFVFKEKLSKKAFAGICLMVVGTLLMVFFK